MKRSAMDPVSDTRTEGPNGPATLLQGVSAQPPDEVADRLCRVLDEAAAAASPAQARELDASVVRALGEAIRLE